jgi:PilZ domain
MAPSPKVDRRRWPRKKPSECPWLIEARLRSGTEVRVVDISNGGVLVETASQIVPGAPVEIFLVAADQRWLVKGRIVRCRVSAIVPERGVRYRAAVAFNEPVSILDELTEKTPCSLSSFDRVQAFAEPAQVLLQVAS